MEVCSFTDAIAEFLTWCDAEHREHPCTANRVRTSFVGITAFFTAAFSNLLVSAINAGHVEKYKTARRKNGIKEVTIRHDLQAMSKFFQYAMKQRWTFRNPVRDVAKPSGKDAIREHVLTAAEEKNVLPARLRGSV